MNREDLTKTLNAIGQQELPKSGLSADDLIPVVYEELHELAGSFLRRESEDHTLQPTALVNEAFIRLVDKSKIDWQGRTHFFALGAQAMRRILVDHARKKYADKRGGRNKKVQLDEELVFTAQSDEDVLMVDDVLEKLKLESPRQAKIVELRFFGGMQMDEIAAAIGVSKRTVEGDWRMVRAWLRRELSDEAGA